MSVEAPKRAIRTHADLAKGVAHLCACEPNFATLAGVLPPPPLRRSRPGFETLLRIIVSQQLSVASADSIWRRVIAKGLLTAGGIRRARRSSLVAAGLSRPKINCIKGLARMVDSGELPLGRLARMPEEEAIATLVQVSGIGPWTAEIYLMFGLGRPDAFAAGDLALQEAARQLFELPSRPNDAELRALAEPWRPWRSVAARVLWQYYRHVKGRAGVTGGG